MNKRYFDDGMVLEAYSKQGIKGVSKLIGKTDIFMYHGESSVAKKAIDYVLSNNPEKADKFLKKCTSNLS